MTTLFTEEEVEQHNSKDDLWIIIHDSVYDVTKYIDEHPGGELVLLQNGGQDATDEFEDNGHSQDARELMADFKIGELAPPGDKKAVPQPDSTSCHSCWWIRIGLVTSAGILVVAFLRHRRLLHF